MRFATRWLRFNLGSGTMGAMEPLAVIRSLSLPSSVEEAWRSVLDAGWLGDRVDLALVAGATGTIAEDGVVRRAVVTEVVEGAALRLVWWDEADPAVVSTVEVEVAADGDGAAVTVTEQVLGGAVALVGEASVLDLGAAGPAWDRRLRALVGEVALLPVGA